MLVNGEAIIHEILNFEIFFSNESTLRLSYSKKNKKKPTWKAGVKMGVSIVNDWFSILIVELEGFEPSSKQAIRKLSTCLFCYWFSGLGREQTPNLNLSF